MDKPMYIPDRGWRYQSGFVDACNLRQVQLFDATVTGVDTW